ncbi:MAG: hypothetical protein ACK40G_08990 [Cytophagaceae bacterium]
MRYFRFLLLVNTTFYLACCQSPEVNSDINGLWADSNSASFNNCYVIFAQEGEDVNFSHYLEFNGVQMVEYGKGKIKGNSLEYNVSVSKAIPGWATSGTHILTLSEDKKTLRGIYKDSKGNSGPIVFKRIN